MLLTLFYIRKLVHLLYNHLVQFGRNKQKYKFEYPEDKLINLSRVVKIIVDDKAKYTDWSHRDDIKAELKMDLILILILAEHGYPPVPKDEVFKEIFEQAENFKRYSD